MRPTTIICKECSEPAPNSTRGAHRQYHAACALKVKARRRRDEREDPEVREKLREYQVKRRAAIKEDPELLKRERERQRLRRERERDRMNAYNEVKSDLLEAQVALAEANDRLNEAASAVNNKFADHERRLRRLEGRVGVPSEPKSDGEPRRATVFDRLR